MNFGTLPVSIDSCAAGSLGSTLPTYLASCTDLTNACLCSSSVLFITSTPFSVAAIPMRSDFDTLVVTSPAVSVNNFKSNL